MKAMYRIYECVGKKNLFTAAALFGGKKKGGPCFKNVQEHLHLRTFMFSDT